MTRTMCTLAKSKRQARCVQATGNSDNWGVLPFSQCTQRTERWRVANSPGVRVMRGMPFACIARGRQSIHYRFRQLPNRVGRLPIMGCRSWRRQPFRTTPPYSAEGRVRAARSAVTLQLQHLRHLRWQMACATRVRRRPMESVLWERMSEAPAPSLAQRVCVAGTSQVYCGVDALDECPRHRHQCQGQARACPNKSIVLWCRG